MKLRTRLLVAVCAASALPAPHARAEPAPADAAAPSLEQQFRDPPQSARPRVWWHWMNGNVTKDGIARDMAWMKRVGIGGLQNFDANLMTPQIVPHRLAYMTPEWQDAFRFAAREAERLGLELAIASSPGWSETGGPWVTPADAMKKLVWSETLVAPGTRFRGTLPRPPGITGPFLSLPRPPGIDAALAGGGAVRDPEYYADVAVLAVPVAAAARAGGEAPAAATVNGVAVDAALLRGDDLTRGVPIARGGGADAATSGGGGADAATGGGGGGDAATRGGGGADAAVVYDYGAPRVMRSATVFLAHASIMFGGAVVAPAIEASDDGHVWRKLADVAVSDVPTTVAFAPARARYFRLVLHPLAIAPANMGAPAPGAIAPDLFGMAAGGAPAPWDLREWRLTGEPLVDQFEQKAGFHTARDYYALVGPDDGASGAAAAQVIDLTPRLRPDGSLDWTAPALPGGQQWRIIRLGASLLGTTNHPASPEATGLEVDKFDGAAVARYMDHYLAMYRDTVGADLIGSHGVRAIVTDSTEVGAANWSPRLLARFAALRGYEARPWLPALAGTLIGSRAETDRFLYDWRRTLADLIAGEHYATVAARAHVAGLRVYGEALEDHRPSLGDDMAMRAHTDVPMAALWTFPQGGSPNLSYLADMKGAASVAHIYGQNLVAAESMTSALTYWADSPRTLKHVIDTEFVTGVNRPVIHTSVHQPVDDRQPGLSLLIFGQYFNRHESWAELARPWMDYMARNALMLQQGRNVADVAYFYGEEAPLTGLYGDKPVADAPTANAYDFLSFDALVGATRNDGADIVTPGGARYKAIYLGGSSSRMTLAGLRRLAALAEGGATIVGAKPVGTPSLSDDAGEYAALVAKLWPGGPTTAVGKGRVIAAPNIDAALAQIGVAPDFRFTGGSPGAEIAFVHRRLADGDSWFLVNRRDRAETIAAHFRVTGKTPELWHAETGASEPVSYRIAGGETVVPLHLDAGDAVHVVFRQPAMAAQATVATPVPTERARLDDGWSVAFQPGRGAPATATLARLAPLDTNPDPAIRHFSGIATYARDFAAPQGWRQGRALVLDLGDVREIAEVTVNGRPAGSVWHAPYTLDIGALVTPGRNHIAVRVANLWVNRLIGDAQPGAKPITWTAMPTYRADAPLRPSGLIGPVRLLTTESAP